MSTQLLNQKVTDQVALFDRRIRQLTRRATLMRRLADDALRACCAELRAAGVDAKLIELPAHWLGHPEPQCLIVDAYERMESGRTYLRRRIHWVCPGPRIGVERRDDLLIVRHGVHDVALTRGLVAIVVPASDDTDQFRRASLPRLRRLAGQEELRVRVRDLEVTLLDPMGNELHTGDVLTSFAFILGIDLSDVEVGS